LAVREVHLELRRNSLLIGYWCRCFCQSTHSPWIVTAIS